MKFNYYICTVLSICIIISINASSANSNLGQPIASLNGGACSFNTIADAIQAAQPNDVVNIRGGTYSELLGEISMNLRLIASRGASGCEIGNNATVTIDGLGQTFDATGGLVKITNASKVTFININMTNASAINGGIMAILDGSKVIIDNSNIFSGSALTSGGNVYIAFESSLLLTNGSTIYDGIVVTGDGGGVALYDSTFTITEGSIGLMGLNQGNSASNNGGGIYAENSIIEINNFESHIQNNQADNFGGGIYAVWSAMTITNTTVNDNTAENSGGGIYSNSSDISIIDATINGNETNGIFSGTGGGGIFLIGSKGEVIIDSTTIVSNISGTSGGGIFNGGGNTMLSIINGSDIINNSSSSGGGIITFTPLSINSSLIRFNTASFSGGGIRCVNCQSLSIVNSSQITNNTAETSGGGLAIFSDSGTAVELKNSTISGNNVTNTNSSSGGGINQEGGTILIDSSTISSNNAGENGGAMSLFDLDNIQNSVRIINSQFTNNSVPSSDFGRGGGALYFNEIFSAQIIGSELNNNFSGLDGGAINLFDSNLIIDDSNISENNAILEGGGIYAEESELIVNNSLISLNEAVGIIIIAPGGLGGGGIKAMDSNLEIINSKINQNMSDDIGGGIFYDGTTNNSLLIKSKHGNLSGECLPSLLGVNEYCSEISNNSAYFGAGLMVVGSINEQGVVLSGIALNGNNSLPNSGVRGAAVHIDLSNPLDTNVNMENLLLVENDGLSDINKSIIFTSGNIVLNLLSTTIANNTVRSFRASSNNTSVIVQNSIIQQNNSGPLVPNNVPFIGLCNNSEMAESGGQSFGPNLGDPQFVTTSRGDYRLSQTSPSLDSCAFGATIDIDGNTRPDDEGNFDQGAFEMGASLFLDMIFKNGFE